MTFYKFMVGIVLTVAMIAVLAGAAMLFAVRDFQYGVAQMAPSTNGLVDIASFLRTDSQIEALTSQNQQLIGDAAAAQNALNEIDSNVQARQAELNQKQAAIDSGISALEQRLHIQPQSRADRDARLATLGAQRGLSNDDRATIAGLNTELAQLGPLQSTLNELRGTRQAAADRLAVANAAAAPMRSQIAGLQSQVITETAAYSRVRAQAIALTHSSPFGFTTELAKVHPSVLSIELLLLMGGLGALLYLFPAYLTRPAPVTMAEIAVRLIFGACVAIAFYVMANAGVAAFSLGAPSTGATSSAAINPFAVSMIGVLAGVLAEDIAQWIQQRGRGVFGGSAPRAAPDAGSAVNPHGGPNAP